jgi:hypothetical protein
LRFCAPELLGVIIVENRYLILAFIARTTISSAAHLLRSYLFPLGMDSTVIGRATRAQPVCSHITYNG